MLADKKIGINSQSTPWNGISLLPASSKAISSQTICVFKHQLPNFIMNAILALLAIVGAANAGLLASAPVYQTAAVAYPAASSHQFNNRAPAARVFAAAPVYAAAPVAVAHHVATPVVAHHAAYVPSAQSHTYNNRAPSAKVAVAAYAAPVAVAHHAVPVAHHAYAAPAVAVGHGYAHAAPVAHVGHAYAPAVAAVGHAVSYHQSFQTPFASYAW